MPEDAYTLMLLSPVAALPKSIDRGTLLLADAPQLPRQRRWRRSGSAATTPGSLVVWGRLPIEGMTGEQLAGLDGCAGRRGSALIREEVAVDDSPDAA